MEISCQHISHPPRRQRSLEVTTFPPEFDDREVKLQGCAGKSDKLRKKLGLFKLILKFGEKTNNFFTQL